MVVGSATRHKTIYRVSSDTVVLVSLRCSSALDADTLDCPPNSPAPDPAEAGKAHTPLWLADNGETKLSESSGLFSAGGVDPAATTATPGNSASALGCAFCGRGDSGGGGARGQESAAAAAAVVAVADAGVSPSTRCTCSRARRERWSICAIVSPPTPSGSGVATGVSLVGVDLALLSGCRETGEIETEGAVRSTAAPEASGTPAEGEGGTALKKAAAVTGNRGGEARIPRRVNPSVGCAGASSTLFSRVSFAAGEVMAAATAPLFGFSTGAGLGAHAGDEEELEEEEELVGAVVFTQLCSNPAPWSRRLSFEPTERRSAGSKGGREAKELLPFGVRGREGKPSISTPRLRRREAKTSDTSALGELFAPFTNVFACEGSAAAA